MKRKGKLPFDPKVFLSKVNGGRAISDYRKDQIVYRQGDPADSVFYVQSGKVKKTVVSVSFFMNKFRELGLIDYNGHIEVHGSLLNVVLHDQPQIRR